MDKSFDNQIRKAINKYGDDYIDIIVEDGNVYGSYHSRHNSFAATDTFPLKQVGGLNNLWVYEKEFIDLCICNS